MPKEWLTIVGIGEDGYESLPAASRAAIDKAEWIIGGKRHLAMIPNCSAQRRQWPKGVTKMLNLVKSLSGQNVCVLASGDPMHFGIGATICQSIPVEQIRVLPAPSAFSLACARLGWIMQHTHCLSAHSCSASVIIPYLYPGAHILLLTKNADTIAETAEILCRADCSDTRIIALANLGGSKEAHSEGTAQKPPINNEKLYILALVVKTTSCRLSLSTVGGLPDKSFLHDGQISKREVRAATLGRLAPHPGALLWDIGAGSASISIEWLRSSPQTKAIAIEKNNKRIELARQNAASLGASRIKLICGVAPNALAGLPSPDAIFIGGGLSFELVKLCLHRLAAGGRMVANAVTVESEAILYRLFSENGGELTRLSVTHADRINATHGKDGRYMWQPLKPVTQWSICR